ncbi:MAG: 50S ribosomal protein L2 [Candidatus Liptonbacteria bacterium RIFCSPLOWO2_01_FULL_52_25]|uniref:Large ribosomal subunit protein uL2 n=1 Tax=Candidatus Liptonbacteria bacterium RIFCSPLOWO2_01_FULL_52_25 TaxID=1798650 RepID=A0A1G2CDG5_9BACT|nr:MAG: 50S ribosomal protein L2 [Candidatus Liptonbacteria bacterium RIFCSPLOWO2_01_FULL_52_25]
MKSYKPTSASRRSMTNVDYSGLSKVEPHKPLLMKLKSRGGRNNQGRITMRHQGGGNAKLYRMVDFGQIEFLNVPGKVETLEYDPYRTAFIAKVSYKGAYRYVLAPHDLKVGDTMVTSESAPLRTGNRLKLRNIPVGYHVYNVELTPGKGGQLARSAGSYAEVLANADGYTDLKLMSGEIRRANWEGFASLGQVSNIEHNLVSIGKAGRSRWLGIRPTVRGKAMNPVDHPYGGGEGSQPRGTRKPKTKWGKITGGHKTRNRKKWSNQLIIERRK